MASRTRIANEAWEALFRAQATIAAELTAAATWDELAPHEYGVLLALSRAPAGLRITQLLDDVLVTQGGMSKLIARLEAAGLVERAPDPTDGRAAVVRLTGAGVAAQRHAGLRHGRHVAQTMTRALDVAQLLELRDLCTHIAQSLRPEPIASTTP